MNLTPQYPPVFAWHSRGTVVTRDGVRRSVRDKETSAKALKGHMQVAHGGKVVESCPACRELKAAQ